MFSESILFLSHSSTQLLQTVTRLSAEEGEKQAKKPCIKSAATGESRERPGTLVAAEHLRKHSELEYDDGFETAVCFLRSRTPHSTSSSKHSGASKTT